MKRYTLILVFIFLSFNSILSARYVKHKQKFGSKKQTGLSKLVKAEYLYKYGDEEAALGIIEEILSKDPENLEANALKSYILKQNYVNKSKQDNVREEMLNSVKDAWNEASIVNKAITIAPLDAEEQLFDKLRKMKVEHIGFADMSLVSVLEQLSILSVELDDLTEDHLEKGINFILIDPTKINPMVHMPIMRNLTLDRVLDYVVKSIGFEYYYESDAVVITPKSDMNTSQLQTRFFPVTRATVLRLTDVNQRQENKEKLNSKINSILEEEKAIKDFFERSGISFDNIKDTGLAFDGTQLIITQTPSNLGKIKTILNKYKLTQQVEIEAKFIDVQEGVLEELGLQWRLSKGNSLIQTQNADGTQTNLRNLSQTFSTASSNGGIGKIISSSGVTPIANDAPILPNAINLAQNAVPFANILGMINKVNVQAIIRALEQQTGSDLMSAPKLTVLSGKSAEIVVAQEFRYPQHFSDTGSEVGTANDSGSSAGVTITAGTPQNFTTRNIGVEMCVTPTIENDGKSINLLLEPKVTEFEGFMEYGGSSVAISGGITVQVPSGFFQPIFSVRQIKTELTVYDGATVVMGGLTREEIKETRDAVPILGSLPLVGRLFKSKGETSQKRNLLIFVTAKITSPLGTSETPEVVEVKSSNSQFANPIILSGS